MKSKASVWLQEDVAAAMAVVPATLATNIPRLDMAFNISIQFFQNVCNTISLNLFLELKIMVGT